MGIVGWELVRVYWRDLEVGRFGEGFVYYGLDFLFGS